MTATTLAVSLGKSAERSDPGALLTWAMSAFTTGQCVINESWGCVISQMCTDNVMTTTWRPLHLPCNIWYTINPSPSG